jgi:hypothetical protein
MRFLLLGCEVILRELSDAVVRSPHLIDVKFLTKGLHDLGAKTMRATIQELIDEVQPGKYDAVILGYGLCGNGLAGLVARSAPLVLTRAHDCIAMLMGDRRAFEAYYADHPGVYYRSVGWVERGADLEPLARDRTGLGSTLEELIAKYGEDNGTFLYEQLTSYHQSYSQLTFIETGLEPDGSAKALAQVEAMRKGWSFETYPGNLSLFHRLMAGDWDDDAFLVVPPGHRITPVHDGRVVVAEKVEETAT